VNSLTLKVEGPAYRGLWIGRHEGKAVMISGAAMPGELVEVDVTRERRDYIEAHLKRVLEPADNRQSPPCPHFGICGGCSFQHIPYDEQVRIKVSILEEMIRRTLGDCPPLAPAVINIDPWHYRLRAQFKVNSEGIGFHMKGTRKTVNISRCLIMSRGVNGFIEKASPFVREFRIRELHVTGDDDMVGQVIARKNALSPGDVDALSSGLMECGLSGLIIRRGERRPLEYGRTYVNLDLSGLQYTVSIQSFIQNNWRLNQEVIRLIREGLQPLSGLRILDLYAGAGNFSLPLAKEADVTAVEDNPFAVRDGRRNVELNGIEGFRYVRSSAEKFETGEKFDVVIVDPPRPGLMYRVVKNIFAIMPGRIVYVSCNPSTFTRDLKRLDEHYRIDSVRLVDFFPQTYHIESLAFLSRRG
jgi:23S rRNA (uracil1939-C5)-methyltransferase